MKTFKIISILIFALFFVQPMFAQSNSRKVVATRIKTENNSYAEQELLREINAYLHSAFENNGGYALVSLDEEDRDEVNKLELLNYIDADVRSTNGEAIDYVFIIWLEHIGKEYKICSKRNGRTNTDYKLGIPVDESEALIGYRPVRELIALEIANQYVALSQTNQILLDKRLQDKANIIEDLTQGSLTKKRKANVKALGLSVIPGVGLMQKGRTGEGVAYLLGDIALIGGGVGMLAYANKQQDIMNDRNTNHDQFITAKRHYDSAKTVSYCCFGAAAALYVVNLVRSYAAEPKPGARIQWSVVPTMNPTSPYGPNMSLNLALTYKF